MGLKGAEALLIEF